MIKKFTYLLLTTAIGVCAISCQEDEVSAPQKPSFQADKTSAEVGESITFTINKVNADAISLLPYGLPGGDPGVLVKFASDQAATVSFSYGRPGTFQAIVVANNHSGDGETLENVKSEPITITIFSSKSSISDFSFKDISSETVIDENAKTINVTVPYGTNVASLKASFTAASFSTVTVGGTSQQSGVTANDFSSPVVYRVTANNGTTSDYTVTVDVTPVETANTINSVSAIAASTGAGNKSLSVSLDNTNRLIVVYDTLGTPTNQFDSVKVGYDLDGEFALLKYNGDILAQNTVLDLTSMKEVAVYSQDSSNVGGIQTYAVYATDAPKLTLSFPGLVPDPAANVKPENFGLAINVLEGTDVTAITTVANTDSPPGAVVSSIAANGQPFVSGVTAVDYSEPVEFELTVTDSNLGVDYTVVYTVVVSVVPPKN